LESNFIEFIGQYIDENTMNESYRNNEDIIIKIINSNLSDEYKLKYIKRNEVVISDISKIEELKENLYLISTLIAKNKILFNINNINNYWYSIDEYDEEFVEYFDKNINDDNFKGILERIHDIRFSEKVFYRQLLDLFATSVDYNKDSGEAKRFFTTVRNKLHFSIHYQTPTELGDNEEVKLVKGELPIYSESKRYFTEEELSSFNQLVSECLDFAEKRAKQECTMTMKDWNYHIEQLLSKIDDDIAIREKLFSESTEIKGETEQTNDAEYTLNQVENHCLSELKKIENIVKNRK